MLTIIEFFRSLFGILFSFLELFVAFMNDLIGIVISLGKLPEILYAVLGWTTSIGISGYVYLIVSFAIVYKIMGREG